jgi:predicted TIM-barrel fold metal-dependent hydrolase
MSRAFVLAIAFLVSGSAHAGPDVFDIHVHLHDGARSLAEYEKAAATDAKAAPRYGAMWFGGAHQALAGDPAAIRAANDAHLALAAKHPRMLPIATVHPHDGDAALAELQRVAAKGVKVLKIHPHTQRFDATDPRVLALVRRAGELNVVVLMDNASIVPADCENLFNLALQAPKTKFVFAHLGALNFRFWNIIAAARTAENLFGDNINFDISAIVAIVADSPIRDEFVWTLRNVGIEHVLFGSDYPQYSLQANLDALDRLGLTDAEKEAIRVGNARKLLGLGAD